MKLVIIRHRESEWNKKNLFTGWSDVDLSDKGVEEAKNAGRTLKENNFDDDIRCSSWIKNRLSLFSWQPIFLHAFLLLQNFLCL
ncbi:MAG: histidine phosphatase family protein [Clostridiales bacterium]|nr:histidine phosphatase family protein [Clostridiales bacterium]MDY2728664.1 histidine phosphatase family protein [Clostridium sp.]